MPSVDEAQSDLRKGQEANEQEAERLNALQIRLEEGEEDLRQRQQQIAPFLVRLGNHAEQMARY